MSRLRRYKASIKLAVTSGLLAVGSLSVLSHPAWGNGHGFHL